MSQSEYKITIFFLLFVLFTLSGCTGNGIKRDSWPHGEEINVFLQSTEAQTRNQKITLTKIFSNYIGSRKIVIDRQGYEIKISLPINTIFNNNQYRIKSEFKNKLDKLAQVFLHYNKSYLSINVIVADDKLAQQDGKLSKLRGRQIKTELTKRYVHPARINYKKIEASATNKIELMSGTDSNTEMIEIRIKPYVNTGNRVGSGKSYENGRTQLAANNKIKSAQAYSVTQR